MVLLDWQYSQKFINNVDNWYEKTQGQTDGDHAVEILILKSGEL